MNQQAFRLKGEENHESSKHNITAGSISGSLCGPHGGLEHNPGGDEVYCGCAEWLSRRGRLQRPFPKGFNPGLPRPGVEMPAQPSSRPFQRPFSLSPPVLTPAGLSSTPHNCPPEKFAKKYLAG